MRRTLTICATVDHCRKGVRAGPRALSAHIRTITATAQSIDMPAGERVAKEDTSTEKLAIAAAMDTKSTHGSIQRDSYNAYGHNASNTTTESSSRLHRIVILSDPNSRDVLSVYHQCHLSRRLCLFDLCDRTEGCLGMAPLSPSSQGAPSSIGVKLQWVHCSWPLAHCACGPPGKMVWAAI